MCVSVTREYHDVNNRTKALFHICFINIFNISCRIWRASFKPVYYQDDSSFNFTECEDYSDQCHPLFVLSCTFSKLDNGVAVFLQATADELLPNFCTGSFTLFPTEKAEGG